MSASRTRKTLDQILPLLLLFTFTLSSVSLFAQDARELQQERTASSRVKGEHPLFELMRTRKSFLRPELMGVHPRGVSLLINPTIAEPANQKFQSTIETNFVTSAGPPGAVDKGERQARGQKLVLTTPASIKSARFITRLTIEN